MAVEESSQSQAAVSRYMSVPEKIELGGGGGARDLPGGGGRYRPMKVPDKITLEPALAPPPPASAVSNREGGEGDGAVRGEFIQRMGNVGQSDGLQPSAEPTHNIPTSNLQGAPPMQMLEPFVGGQTSASLVDLERRVRTLEHQVQRLTDTVVNSRAVTRSSASSQGNGFWYVLTFTGWMMVPLVVVFMYHIKKSP